MTKEKAERIVRIYNWVRLIILVLFLTFVFIGVANAQTTNDFCTWTQVDVEKSFKDKWNIAGGSGYSIDAHHAICFGCLLDLKLPADGSKKALHVVTMGYTYKL